MQSYGAHENWRQPKNAAQMRTEEILNYLPITSPKPI
jgi:hypothetical protein